MSVYPAGHPDLILPGLQGVAIPLILSRQEELASDSVGEVSSLAAGLRQAVAELLRAASTTVAGR